MPSKRPDALDRLIGRKIRLYRTLRGWTQGELAMHIGVTYQQVQKYERASCRVSASALFRIARSLGVSLEAFFGAQPSADHEAEGAQGDSADVRLTDDLTEACVNIARKRLRSRVAALVREFAAACPTSKRQHSKCGRCVRVTWRGATRGEHGRRTGQNGKRG